MLDQPYSATLGMLRSVSTAARLISASDHTPRTRGPFEVAASPRGLVVRFSGLVVS